MLPAAIFLIAFTAGTRIVPVNPDSVGPYQPVFLSARGDRLLNCDANTAVSALDRAATEKGGGKNAPVYDQFRAENDPVRQFTFLHAAGDSIFLIATVEKNSDTDDYAKFCVEKKEINGLYVEQAVEPHRSGPKKDRGGHGGWAGVSTELLTLALVVGLIFAIQYWG